MGEMAGLRSQIGRLDASQQVVDQFARAADGVAKRQAFRATEEQALLTSPRKAEDSFRSMQN